MAEHPGEKTAQLILSPVGGFLIAVFLAPVGCTDPSKTALCPVGEKTNLIGSTVFGMVGVLDGAGLFFLGLLVAGLTYLVFDIVTVKR